MGDSAKTDAPKGSFWKGIKCVSLVMGLVITFLDTLIQFAINFVTAL